MINVVEVKNKKQIKQFIEFPLKLYKGNPYYVPALYMDERAIFKKDFAYSEDCDHIFFLAYDSGKVVGRIQGIIQKEYNKIHSCKRARFSRFDSINDKNVSRALFSACELWAKEQGMDTMCGPLGYSDLEREGLLIEGFDYLSTFEEAYNYDYYQSLVEDYGFEKEVDWLEHRLTKKEGMQEKIHKLTLNVIKRYDIHFDAPKKGESRTKYLKRLLPDFFDLIDEGYKEIYGTVPFTKKMKESLLSEFLSFIDLRFLFIARDKDENMVGAGVGFPGIGKAIQKSGGRLTPITLLKLLGSIKNPKSIDLGLVALKPEYLKSGVAVCALDFMYNVLDSKSVEYMETNLNLEDNTAILSMWDRMEYIQHKRRRAFVKKIN